MPFAAPSYTHPVYFSQRSDEAAGFVMERKLENELTGGSSTSTGTSYTRSTATNHGIPVPARHGIMITVSGYEYTTSTRGVILVGYGSTQDPTTSITVSESG